VQDASRQLLQQKRNFDKETKNLQKKMRDDEENVKMLEAEMRRIQQELASLEPEKEPMPSFRQRGQMMLEKMMENLGDRRSRSNSIRKDLRRAENSHRDFMTKMSAGKAKL